ncbi:MAG: hypothetical protein EXR75_15415 [Myxococcales bacterium]|nr:hypothetical protein [Myxococcales bacterium]
MTACSVSLSSSLVLAAVLVLVPAAVLAAVLVLVPAPVLVAVLVAALVPVPPSRLWQCPRSLRSRSLVVGPTLLFRAMAPWSRALPRRSPTASSSRSRAPKLRTAARLASSAPRAITPRNPAIVSPSAAPR